MQSADYLLVELMTGTSHEPYSVELLQGNELEFSRYVQLSVTLLI